jgi:sugar lactone lactonase YvrE
MRLLPLALLLLGLASPALAEDDAAALAAKINAAHKAGDYAGMEAGAREFLALIPQQPRAYYLLAVARANRGDQAGALEALGRMADMGVSVDIKAQDFHSLESAPGWQALSERFAALAKPVGRAAHAFQLDEPDFIPEGIARDPKSGDFFVSSVHLRKIIRVHAGKETLFADRNAGLWSVLGMHVDERRGSLWATTSALPQMEDYADALAGKTALVRIDLKTGKLLANYVLPADGTEHELNDVALGPDGSVYAADGSGGVYVLDPGANALRLLTPPGAVHSAQGMAVSPDGKLLYFADYALGLFAYRLQDRMLTRITAADGIYTYYVDGLAFHGRDLVATQNAAEPQRLVCFRLDGTGLKIWGAQVLSAADPQAPEPTLFTLDGDDAYLVGNSQWSRFDDKNNLPPNDQLQKPLILKVALP